MKRNGNLIQENLFEGIDPSFIRKQAIKFNNHSKDNYYNKKKKYSIIISGIIIFFAVLLKYFEIPIIADRDVYLSEYKEDEYIGVYTLVICIMYIVIFFLCTITNLSVKGRIIKRIDSNYVIGLKDYYNYKKNNTNVSTNNNIFLEELALKIENIILKLISPDYILANKAKETLVENVKQDGINKEYKPKWFEFDNNLIGKSDYEWLKIQIERKFLIEWSNWANIVITVRLFLIVTLIYIFEIFIFEIIFDHIIDGNLYYKINDFIWLFLALLIGYRIISRGIEIIIAFYKDVVSVDSKLFYNLEGEKQIDFAHINLDKMNCSYINGFRFTLLRSQARLSLAIHTLIELFILFTILYLSFSFIIEDFWGTNMGPSLVTSIFYSLSLGVFNVSFDPQFVWVKALFHVLQVVLSCILILLSVAQYLNGKTEMEDGSFEYEFYKELKIIEQKKNIDGIKIIDKKITSALGNYKIFIGKGITHRFIDESKENIEFKYNHQICTFKIRKATPQTSETLDIIHCESISIKFIGIDKIYLFLT